MHKNNQKQLTLIHGTDTPFNLTKESLFLLPGILFLKYIEVGFWLIYVLIFNLLNHTDKMPAYDTADTMLIGNLRA
jgi:hypothetical protein